MPTFKHNAQVSHKWSISQMSKCRVLTARGSLFGLGIVDLAMWLNPAWLTLGVSLNFESVSSFGHYSQIDSPT